MTKLKDKKPSKLEALKAMSPKDRNRAIGDMLMNNAMFIIIAIAVVGIWIAEPTFLSIPSIVNIINLTAAKLPIALGVGGCIILAGTDISAGRVVGLSACIAAGVCRLCPFPLPFWRFWLWAPAWALSTASSWPSSSCTPSSSPCPPS